MSVSTETREVEIFDAKGGNETSSKDTNSEDEGEDRRASGQIPSTEKSTITTKQEKINGLILSVERDESSSSPTADEDASPAATKTATTSPEEQDKQPTVMKAPLPTVSSESIKFDKDIARLKEVLSDVSDRAAQSVLRQNWRKFLFEGYDEDHVSFILRAGLKNANSNILQRVLKDDTLFKEPLQKYTAKNPKFVDGVLHKVKVEDLLNKVPEQVLDVALFQRLENVDADSLVAWLAHWDRLGFRKHDKVALDDEGDETIIPGPRSPILNDSVEAPVPAKPSYEVLASGDKDPLLEQQERQLANQRRDTAAKIAAAAQEKMLLEEQRQRDVIVTQHQTTAVKERDHQAVTAPKDMSKSQVQLSKPVPQGPWACPDCNQSLPTFSGYTYHIHKKPCTKQPPPGHNGWKFWCSNCCSGFTQSVGLSYHKKRQVCENNEIVPATAPSHQEANGWQSPSAYPRPMAPPRPDAIVSLPRPPMHSQPQGPILPPSSAKVQKPPLSTPSYSTPTKIPETDIRHSPSELAPEKLAALNAELQKATDAYNKGMSEIPEEWDQMQKDARTFSLKNQWSTKKSQIRKKYGVSLRMREKEKEARRAAGIDPPKSKRLEEFRAEPSSSPSFSPVNTPSATTANRYEASHNSQYATKPASRPSEFQGFGVLQPNKAHSAPYQPHSPPPNKRHRSEETEPQTRSYHPNYAASQPTSGLAMVETSSEDAASKFARKSGPFVYRKSSAEPTSSLPIRSGEVVDLADSESDDEDGIPAVARKAMKVLVNVARKVAEKEVEKEISGDERQAETKTT